MNEAAQRRIEQEVERVAGLCREMIDAYVAWGDRLAFGETYNTMYGDILDFVNFRIETADSCLLLTKSHRVADALGLCRSLLEHYLLLMLMCRGDRFFQLQDLTGLSQEEFRSRLKEQVAAWEAEVAEGATNCLEVCAYPRAKRHIMYVYEGLKSEGDAGFRIPIHYFQFQEFRPETMRLDSEHYFEYYDRDADLKRALKEHRREAKYQYQHYLSYQALLECLSLNGIAGEDVQLRIDAHYTFLGTFLHPTHEAASRLHDRGFRRGGMTQTGRGGRYTVTAHLLALLYVAKLLAGLLSEICGLLEAAPSKFVTESGTAERRRLIPLAETS
jgi:hypothetical protein